MLEELRECFMEAYDDNKDGEYDMTINDSFLSRGFSSRDVRKDVSRISIERTCNSGMHNRTSERIAEFPFTDRKFSRYKVLRLLQSESAEEGSSENPRRSLPKKILGL